MRGILILTILTVLVCVPRAYGQCSMDLHPVSKQVMCQCGSTINVYACSLMGSGCDCCTTDVPCGENCFLESASSCDAVKKAVAHSMQPGEAERRAGCQCVFKLAQLEEWAKANPYPKHKRELRAEIR